MVTGGATGHRGGGRTGDGAGERSGGSRRLRQCDRCGRARYAARTRRSQSPSAKSGSAAILRQDFDLPRIARYVLGRYWTSASADERANFTRLFEQWVVQTYGARLSRYSQETVTVTGTRPENGADAVVTSAIVHPSGPPTHVAWRVSGQPGSYRIVDIDVEGVSMALTEREEIAAVIERSGRTVTALNRSLEEKLRGAGNGAQADR